MFEITAKKREKKEKVTKDEVKAVYYGSGVESTPITINSNDFNKVWEKAGESSTISLKVGTTVLNALINEVQVDPVTSFVRHADFLVIDMTKKITVSVPLEYTGVSEAVKSGLGILVKVLREVEVEALPTDLPNSISVDISSLVDVDSVILISNLIAPKGVSFVAKGSKVVASIALQKEEEEIVEEVAPDLSSIEVEKKGKKDEDESEEKPALETEEKKEE